MLGLSSLSKRWCATTSNYYRLILEISEYSIWGRVRSETVRFLGFQRTVNRRAGGPDLDLAGGVGSEGDHLVGSPACRLI
jgi:hypothetical protein